MIRWDESANGPDTEVSKPSNPKDIIGSTKVPLGLVPSAAIAEEALALLDGMMKYGRSNWRAAGVRSSIYMDAAMRHIRAWWDGEDYAPDSGAHHLGAARACLAVVLDALACGMLIDDRPPTTDFPSLLPDYNRRAKEIIERYADSPVPHHWTIHDPIPGKEK